MFRDKQSAFDPYAESYSEMVEQAIAVSGEGRDYFERRRLEWLARCLREMDVRPRAVLDYGCGTGSAVPWLVEILSASRVMGVEDSPRLVEIARKSHSLPETSFQSRAEYRPAGDFDLVFSSCVFHHISPADRPAALATIRESLVPRGLFALWEQNPWNPATRFIMRQCEFDRDAVTLATPEARGLLNGMGFEVLRTDFLFIFPRLLRVLRPLESLVTKVPLGAQYQVLCRRVD